MADSGPSAKEITPTQLFVCFPALSRRNLIVHQSPMGGHRVFVKVLNCSYTVIQHN